jgi:uncharacterized protein YecT (DUF1311 family)
MAVSNNRPPDRDPDVEIIGDRETARRISPVLIGLIVTVLALLALIFVVGRDGSSSSDDRLGNTLDATSGQTSPDGMCANATTYGLVKQALFREAAQLRGSDQAAFDQLAGSAFARMEAPVMTGEDKTRGAVSCSGSLTLQLPPGLAVVGGRRVLSGEIDYVVQPAADGSGTVVTLSHAEGIVTPLATLTRMGGAAPIEPGAPQPTDGVDPLAPVSEAPVTEPQPAQDGPAADPSFNCDNARTRGEIAVCTDPGLANLDRQMASQFNYALSGADAEQRAILGQTRDRFLRFRDNCRTSSCIADAYRGRIREVRDIMNGSWQPPR